ncbi:MAG: hypothetical protein KAH25_12140, partial [Bacteroidales bacterium]|nr:hypothetical protein [Bacteroidales bacterium]
MDLIKINSYKDLQEQLTKTPKAFLLLYKSGAEASDCAIMNAQKVSHEEVSFMIADVSVVRDIHGEYGIKTAPILLSFQDGKLENSYKGCNDVSFYEKIFKQDFFVALEGDDKKPQKRV